MSGGNCGMTRGEAVAAAFYLPLHVAVLPILLPLANTFSHGGTDIAHLNLIYYCVGILFVALFERRLLRRDFDALLDGGARSVLTLAACFALNMALTMAVSMLIYLLLPDLGDNPNNENVSALAAANTYVMMAQGVILAPFVEEVLFRGFLYGVGKRRFGRIGAALLSAALFGLYHVWQYAVGYGNALYLVFALQYVPPALALAWGYEKSRSLWVPIAAHMLMNAASFALS